MCQVILYQIYVIFHKGGIADEETEGAKAILINYSTHISYIFCAPRAAVGSREFPTLVELTF